MNSMVRKLRRRQRWFIVAISLIAIVGFGWAIVAMKPDAPNVTTAEVKLGEFVDYVQVRGELKAMKSIVLSAPSGAGDIQIVSLVKNGSMVKKGDVVVQFDTTSLQRTLDQKRSEFKTTEGEIGKTRAEGRIKEEENLTQVTKNRYDVQRAELEVGKREILSEIDGEKAKLTLSDAEQKFLEVGTKLKSDREATSADVESKKQKREKALFEVRESERNITAMSLKAPVDGLVTLMPNWRAGTSWDNAPEFKEGDRAWPGAPIVQLPDLSSVRVTGRVDETERGRVKPEQKGVVKIDAVPGRDFAATVSEIGTLAKLDFSTWPPPKNFDVALQLKESDPKMRPGMSATARIAVDRVPNAILIPPEASFQKEGKSVAYVYSGLKFEERTIEIMKRGSDVLWVAKGLRPGEKVALNNPTAEALP